MAPHVDEGGIIRLVRGSARSIVKAKGGMVLVEQAAHVGR
jgi:hypothetical protein